MEQAATGSSNSAGETREVMVTEDGVTSPAKASNWLDAHSDCNAGIYTFSQCIALADLNNDGDYRLIIADHGHKFFNMKLRVYRGTSMVAENPLLDLPVALVAFHMDLAQPRIPAIAVASGPHIYIYKNLRPYFKFSLPPLEVSAVERDVWAQARDGDIHVDVLHEMLTGFSREQGFSQLTARSQHLLMMRDPAERRHFVEEIKAQPLKKQTVLTCMTSLKKSMPDDDAVSCLVLGTENGHIYILDSEAFTILDTAQVRGVPALLAATGLRDVEFRVIVGCRGREVAILKRGWKEAKTLMQLPAHAVALAVQQQGVIVVALMDQTLRGYTRKGKEVWRVNTDTTIRCMVGVPLPQHAAWAAAVGLSDGRVMLYMDGQLVDIVPTHSAVSALACGTFGRGEHCLIITTADGALLIKILRRTANFTPQATQENTAEPSQLAVPKKTKLFVEQTVRERENATMMHHTFQHEILRLKLRTARACVASLSSDSNPLALSEHQPLRLSAQVRGLGPVFQLRVTLENMSQAQAAQGLTILLHFDTKLYTVDRPFVQVPLLVSGVPFELETQVTHVGVTQGLSGVVRALVVQGRAPQPPLLAALIHMPNPEPAELVF